jgi:hypothetical protein
VRGASDGFGCIQCEWQNSDDVVVNVTRENRDDVPKKWGDVMIAQMAQGTQDLSINQHNLTRTDGPEMPWLDADSIAVVIIHTFMIQVKRKRG